MTTSETRLAGLIALALIVAACGGGTSGGGDADTGGAAEWSGDINGGRDGREDLSSEADTGEDLIPGTDLTESAGETIPPVDSVEPSEAIGDATDGGDGEGPVDPGCAAIHGEGWAFNPSAATGDGCKDCTGKIDCDVPGADGLHDRTTTAGQCICRTLPDYFFSSTVMAVLPCDRDRDGWVTVTARDFVDNADVALRDNARCAVMRPTTIELRPDEARPATFVPVSGLALYEPNNRDDQAALALDPKVVPLGAGGRAPLASELNALTKACVSRTADFNGNGASDVSETPVSSGIAAEYKAYAGYAYFMELHRSWYDAASQTLILAERTRQPDPEGVSVGFGGLPDGWWRSCTRGRDAAYNPQVVVTGFDLATFEGLHHHSQFKCLDVVKEADVSAAQPHKMTAEALQAAYQPNACAATADPVAPWTPVEPTPQVVSFTCADADALAEGAVVWGVTRHAHYDQAGQYVRGCVNPCVEGWEGLPECPGYDLEHAACASDAADFDRPSCACLPAYTGSGCDQCAGHWGGPLCDQCPPPWQGPGCDQCPNHFTGPDCHECPPPWEGPHCDRCQGHFDEATGCATCDASATEGHWTGDACDQCDPHFAGPQCSTCANRWTPPDCQVCPFDDALGYWDPETNCAECWPHHAAASVTTPDLLASLSPPGCDDGTCWAATGDVAYQVTSSGTTLTLLDGAFLGHLCATSVILPLDDLGLVVRNLSYPQVEVQLGVTGVSGIGGADLKAVLVDADGVALGTPYSCTMTTGAGCVGSTLDTYDISANRYEAAALRVTVSQVLAGTQTAEYTGLRVRLHAWADGLKHCTTCLGGWRDDPTTPGHDCDLCPSGLLGDGVTDGGHWALADDECYVCQDDAQGHYGGATCTECADLWSPPMAVNGCTQCQGGNQDGFQLDDTGDCTHTVNLVQNGGGEQGTDGWIGDVITSVGEAGGALPLVGSKMLALNPSSFVYQEINLQDGNHPRVEEALAAGKLARVRVQVALNQTMPTSWRMNRLRVVLNRGNEGFAESHQVAGTDLTTCASITVDHVLHEWTRYDLSCPAEADVHRVLVYFDEDNQCPSEVTCPDEPFPVYVDDLAVTFQVK